MRPMSPPMIDPTGMLPQSSVRQVPCTRPSNRPGMMLCRSDMIRMFHTVIVPLTITKPTAAAHRVGTAPMNTIASDAATLATATESPVPHRVLSRAVMIDAPMPPTAPVNMNTPNSASGSWSRSTR